MSKETALATLTGQSPGLAPVETPVVSETPKPIDSDRFAHLAKKEAEIVRQRAEFKKEREAFELGDKKKAMDALAIATKFEETRKTDPIAALKMIGFSETEIINYMAEAEPPTLTPEEIATKAATAAVEAKLKERDEAEKARLATAAKERDEKSIAGYKESLGKLIEADKDKYEYCAYHGPTAQDLVYSTVLELLKEANASKTAIEIDKLTKEAIEMVENYYEEEDKAMSTIKKRQPVATPAAEATTPERTRTLDTPGKDTPKPAITHTRTLSSAARVTGASSATRNETREQKRDRLIEALRNGAKP